MKRDKLSEEIRDVLKRAPVVKGFSIKELAKATGTPWSTTRWHLESLESRGIVGHMNIGKAKLYFLKGVPSQKKANKKSS